MEFPKLTPQQKIQLGILIFIKPYSTKRIQQQFLQFSNKQRSTCCTKYKYICPWCRIEDQKQRFSKAPYRIMNKKALKYLEKMNRRQCNINEQSQHNNQSHVQQFYYCPSASSKQSYLEELLKKNGGFCQQASQEEIQVDLQKMMSLMKQ